MRYPRVLALAISLWTYQPAMAGTLFAAHEFAEPAFERNAELCGVGAGGLVGYVGSDPICADLVIKAIGEAVGLEDGTTAEVVLLTSRPATKTLYRPSASREPILPLDNLARPTHQPLKIRGQRDANGAHLVWFKGLELIDTICDPARVLDEEACRAGRPARGAGREVSKDWERLYEVTSLALVEEARRVRPVERRLEEYGGVAGQRLRQYCVHLRRVSGLVLEDLGFEDCWLTAITAVNSRRIELRGARIHGSTSGMLAIATTGFSAEAHSYVVADSHWIQSPGAYRADAEPCTAPHLDLRCAIDVWDDLPWGVTHHHIWRPLNGGLFAALNIAGNVLIENNFIERAFNGIRIISEKPRTGRNVTISGNRFHFIRDNAVEPEEVAEDWIIKHNLFANVHAWISIDGVRGRGFYVFGNQATYDPEAMPGSGCSDDIDWASSPFFVGLASDAGHYELLDVSYDPTTAECRGHYRGAVLKTGDKRSTGFPYLESVSIFHNSWRTRSPLWGNKHAPPLVHFNNLVAFTGCGLEGPWHCRQIPTPSQYCEEGNQRTRGRVALPQYWTDDGGALVADCVSLVPGPAEPDERAAETRAVEHRFCRDLYNRGFGGVPYGRGPCAPVFDAAAFVATDASPPDLFRSISGCRATVSDGATVPDCDRSGGRIGAVQDDGRLFDLDIDDAGYQGEAFRP